MHHWSCSEEFMVRVSFNPEFVVVVVVLFVCLFVFFFAFLCFVAFQGIESPVAAYITAVAFNVLNQSTIVRCPVNNIYFHRRRVSAALFSCSIQTTKTVNKDSLDRLYVSLQVWFRLLSGRFTKERRKELRPKLPKV